MKIYEGLFIKNIPKHLKAEDIVVTTTREVRDRYTPNKILRICEIYFNTEYHSSLFRWDCDHYENVCIGQYCSLTGTTKNPGGIYDRNYTYIPFKNIISASDFEKELKKFSENLQQGAPFDDVKVFI